MKRLPRILIGGILFALGVAICALLWITRPKAEQKPDIQSLPVVETIAVRYGPKSFEVPSQGIVEATKRSSLAAEVSGKILETSEKFDPGHEIKKGEVLLRIDPTDYEAALAQAKSTLADMEAALATEKARAEQAERDWRRLGRGGEPSDLVKRGPQLRSAEAKVAASKAAVAKAEYDLDRTTVRSPYDAVIASTAVDVGSFLSPGSPVAEVFSTGPLEVRLPLSIDEMPFLETDEEGRPTGAVSISAEIAGQVKTWTGVIVRTEGEIDRSTRSAYVVAEIEPLSEDGSMRLQPGQFVRAAIPGREIPGLAEIPFSAFLDLERVAIVDAENRLRFRETEVVFREGDLVYVSGGPAEGERLSLTELSGAIQGDEVDPKPVSPSPGPGETANLEASPKP